MNSGAKGVKILVNPDRYVLIQGHIRPDGNIGSNNDSDRMRKPQTSGNSRPAIKITSIQNDIQTPSQKSKRAADPAVAIKARRDTMERDRAKSRTVKQCGNSASRAAAARVGFQIL
jgi:hypothetical protein